MCYYYPDAAKLGGAIMAGEGSTSAPSECFWWQVFLLPIWTSLTGLILYLGKRSISLRSVYESAASFISGVGSPTNYCAATRTGTASAFGPLIN